MSNVLRNDLGIDDRVADQWWSDEVRWVRTLKNLVPGRLAWFGPVTELYRSFDLVFCHKGETSWHRTRPQNSAQKPCGWR